MKSIKWQLLVEFTFILSTNRVFRCIILVDVTSFMCIYVNIILLGYVMLNKEMCEPRFYNTFESFNLVLE